MTDSFCRDRHALTKSQERTNIRVPTCRITVREDIMEKWIMLVYTNCTDPSREKEFNDWYDNTHVADVLEVPGFLNATRYANNNPSEGTGRFLAIYEIETEDIGKTMAALQENRRKWTEQGRMSGLAQLVSVAVCSQISSALP